MRGAFRQLTALLALVWIGGCGPKDSEPCYSEGDEVPPDEVIDGEVVLDLVAPYFGSYAGTLAWESGGQANLYLEVAPEEGRPLRAGAGKCNDPLLSYWANATIRTDDDAFDNELHLSLRHNPRPESYQASDVTPNFDALASWQFEDAVWDHFNFDTTRYESSSLHFEVVDWPSAASGPQAFVLTFTGVLALEPTLYDTIVVGDVMF